MRSILVKPAGKAASPAALRHAADGSIFNNGN
jgi:hypothetical protein